jgi:hypothetical protein
MSTAVSIDGPSQLGHIVDQVQAVAAPSQRFSPSAI